MFRFNKKLHSCRKKENWADFKSSSTQQSTGQNISQILVIRNGIIPLVALYNIQSITDIHKIETYLELSCGRT